MKWLAFDISIPKNRARCRHRDHRRVHTVVGWMMHFERTPWTGLPIEHALLEATLYDVGKAMIQTAAKHGYDFQDRLLISGPLPSFGAGKSGWNGQKVKGFDPDRQADLILRTAGIVPDMVRYRLYGQFVRRRELAGGEAPDPAPETLLVN